MAEEKITESEERAKLARLEKMDAIQTSTYARLSLSAKLEYATQLVKSGILPKTITTPQAALVVMETGMELGIPPMMALRCVYVIQGTPSLKTELMVAIAKKHGYQVQWPETTPSAATCRVTAPTGESMEQRFTLEDAKRIGLTTKDGWKNYPAEMCRWRSASALLRAMCPHLLGGMLAVEEAVAIDSVISEPAVATVAVADHAEYRDHEPSAPAGVDTETGEMVGSASGDDLFGVDTEPVDATRKHLEAIDA